MTDKEWQTLCRTAKNNGTYIQLTKAIKWYTTKEINTNPYYEQCEDTAPHNNVHKFIKFFNKSAIKDWYQNYYKNKKHLYDR